MSRYYRKTPVVDASGRVENGIYRAPLQVSRGASVRVEGKAIVVAEDAGLVAITNLPEKEKKYCDCCGHSLEDDD